MKVLLVMMFILCAASASHGDLRPMKLRCESLVDPLGIDASKPRFSWMLESGERGQAQSAYQILVSSDERAVKSNRGVEWDSGKVLSDESLHIEYGGRQPLSSFRRYFWRVRVWDRSGRPSAYSPVATFETGALDKTNWHAKWIGRTTSTDYQPAPHFRKTFNIESPFKRARVYVSGLGYYDLRINGKRVGDHALDPGYTRYDRRVLYTTLDVTRHLKRGKNVIAAALGTGWYNVHSRAVWYFDRAPWRAAPKLFLELRLDDGAPIVVSDESWRTSGGPIVYDSIYGGESYDARLEQPGWDTAGFDDSGWETARIVDAPKGQFRSQVNPPIKVSKALSPARILEPKPGTFVFDFGENIAGWARLSVKGPAGTEITLRYGEKIHPDGSLDRSNIDVHMVKTTPPQRFQTDTYTCKGTGSETWEPRFTYHGFQYVEVTGLPVKPTSETLTAKFCHSAVESVGEFLSSNELLNKIWEAGRRAYLSNLQSIPTDCPHREKNGWTGDAHLACEQALFNFDSATVYAKWINDLNDEQKPTGELPGIVPTSGWGYEWGNGPAWDSAYLLVPWYVYVYTGDKRILTDHYEGFKRYVDYLTSRADKGIVSIGLGDWAPWKTQTPVEVTSTGYYYVDALIVAKTAELLGRTDDARKYRDLAASIKNAFNDRFVNRETGNVANGSQTALSCALYQDLLDVETRPRTLARLTEAVQKTGGHIDTGILGAKYILNALTDMGRADLAFQMTSKETQPGWGWWIKQGATTLWEQWNGTESRNHIMYGDILAWFTKSLAGINPDPESPGFKRFTIRPRVVGDLEHARFQFESARGPITSAWKLIGGGLELTVRVPTNTTATISVPARNAESVTQISDGGRGAKPAARLLRFEDGHAVYEVGGGFYGFRSVGHNRIGKAAR